MIGVFRIGISTIAVIVGVIWIWINTYHLLPIFNLFLRNLLTRHRKTEEANYLEAEEEKNQKNQPDYELDGGTIIKDDGGLDGNNTTADDERPVIDLMIPAYEEGEIIEQAISSARSSEYPQNKLNLLVLLEPDDTETQDALDEMSTEYEFDTVTVPTEYPGDPNKPRALNYGFEQTSGEIVGILDAEELLAAGLPSRAAERLDGDCDFVQGQLDMVNEDDGWLNTMFRAEYGYWYETSLEGFSRMDYPIPMAGTTCFFRRQVLEEVSEIRKERYGNPWEPDDIDWLTAHGLEGTVPWDPNNVTEDFELGLLLWEEDYEFGYIHATTQSESPMTLDSWIKQRTRWQKGKIYTLRQYLKYPPDGLLAKLHIYTQSAVPHLGAVNFTAALVVLLGANLFRGYTPPESIVSLLNISLLFAIIMAGLYGFGYWVTSGKSYTKKARRTGIVVLSLPIYWAVQWIADLRAIRQIYTGDLHWSKTTHSGRNLAGVARETGKSFWQSNYTLPRSYRLTTLVSILLVGAALRLYDLGTWSLYGDELYSFIRAQRPIWDLITIPLTTDSHPPLYYALLHYWMDVFGTSAVAIRLLTVVFSIATLASVYKLGTALYDDRVGLIATFLLATSTFYIHFGRVARMYSLVTLLTVVSWYLFIQLRTRLSRVSVMYVITSSLLIYTHVYALFVIFAQNVYVALSESHAGISRKRWSMLQSAIIGLVSPWLLMLTDRVLNLTGSARKADLVTWIPMPDGIRSIIETLSRFVGFPVHYPLLQGTTSAPLENILNPWGLAWQLAALLLTLYIVVAFFGVVTYRADGSYSLTGVSQAGQLCLLFLCPILIPFVISYLIQPVYWARYTIPASIGFFLLVAKGIASIRTPNLKRAVLGFILVSSAFMTGIYYTQSSVEDWRGTLHCLEDGAEAEDGVFYQASWIEGRLDIYDSGTNATEYRIPKQERLTDTDIDRIERHARDHTEVWLVRYQPGVANKEKDKVYQRLASAFEVVSSTRDGGFVYYRFYRDESIANAESEDMSGICPSSSTRVW